jgi:hypothetical protein
MGQRQSELPADRLSLTDMKQIAVNKLLAPLIAPDTTGTTCTVSAASSFPIVEWVGDSEYSEYPIVKRLPRITRRVQRSCVGATDS